ncbi:MAG: transcriptional repressor [Acidimicrobiia bacterium]|nr:transcriptional repressor [Acidimicrobiia bacterium]
MRSDGRRLGAARRQVIEALSGRAAPVSAEELAEELPSIHVSSIYRSLAVLEEMGLVRHVHLTHGAALYELADENPDSQYLVCDVCGRDIAVPSKLFDKLREVIDKDYGFVLQGGHFALPGHCTNCDPASVARPHPHAR